MWKLLKYKMNSKLAKKAQVVIEFMALTSFLLLMFSILFISIQNSSYDKNEERKNLEIKQIAIIIQDEVNLASQSIDGYEREFRIPKDLSGTEYEIGIVDSLVFVKTSDEKHALTLPVLISTANITKGINIISKNNGEVKLND